MSAIVLGLSFGYHDSSAAIIKDGVVLAAASEERFSRIKHDDSFPSEAIEFCLEAVKVCANELDAIVYYEDPYKKIKRLMSVGEDNGDYFANVFLDWIRTGKIDPIGIISDKLKVDRFKVCFTDHHLSHAAAAFFPSLYEEAAILTIDGVGEFETLTISKGFQNKIEKKLSIALPNSLGLVYSAFTHFLGFEVNEGEYKVMGMASFGEPIYCDKLKPLFLDDEFEINVDVNYFEFSAPVDTHLKPPFFELFGKPRDSKAPFFITEAEAPSGMAKDDILALSQQNKYYADIAASLQKLTEDCVIAYAKKALNITGSKNLCMAGGVALNATANGKIKENLKLDGFFVQPASGDGGSAVGAALYYYYSIMGNSRLYSAFDTLIGKSQTIEQMKKDIDFSLVDGYKKFNNEGDFLEAVCEVLTKRGVVGWFYGGFEYGPRALGARSILANPATKEMQRIVNEKIKFREPFRPFAPSVLKSEAKDWFFLQEPLDDNSPEVYMLSIVKAKEKASKEAAAIVHTDGTSRIQLVDSRNGLYYKLIYMFFQKTGVPMLLDTSFNLRGEPIVSSLKDAIKTFELSGMDILAAYPFIVYKKAHK